MNVTRFLALLLCLSAAARGEAMLQYFNTSYAEITRRMPELAELGYGSLWLPPPAKGSGGLSVGYDCWDRFDLGSVDQRGSARTRYGTEAELLRLIETAHRFGIRVYFDNIMNHNAFDIPGFNEFTPIDVYPGFVPEDFHLRTTEEGFYRKWDNTRNWGDAWQVQHLGLSDLIDIAHESPNRNHGRHEGDWHPKYVGVRHPGRTEFYRDRDLPQVVNTPGGAITVWPFADKEAFTDGGCAGCPAGSAGNGRFDWADADGDGQHDAGEASEPFEDTGVDGANPDRRTAGWGFGDGVYNMGDPVAEDVNALLIRSARWFMDRTHADGLRLDAVKHVPDWFFGQQGGGDRDWSGAGYLGAVQEQFNLVRGFSDWDNHRDSVFDTEAGRDDAMVFGEHLGEPPGFGGYIDAGMRLVDNELRSWLNGRLGSPWAGIGGLDQPGGGGFAPAVSVMHAQSHDNDFAAMRELQHATYFTRAGLPLLYTDGNHHAETLGESGGAFPRHANTTFLGQWGDPSVPNQVYLHEHFARGWQRSAFSDPDLIAYERIDKRENAGMTDADGTVLLFMMNDNTAAGQARPVSTSFAHTPGGPDSWLYNYSYHGGGFYEWASNLGNVIVPPGGYFAFSWRSPEEAAAWRAAGGRPVTIEQGGQAVAATMPVVRRDGPDGDPGFNPHGLPDKDPTDYSYTTFVPRVTEGSDLRFVVRTDGSAENVLLKLDGGMDLNGVGGRDHPPAVSTDVFLGYEQMDFVHRQHQEKFAAEDTDTRNVIGSLGAETWTATIGTAGVATAEGNGPDSDADTARWVFHDPRLSDAPGGARQFPDPATAAGAPLTVWVKMGNGGITDKCFAYYTVDGSFPEGAGGEGVGTTRTSEMLYVQNLDGGEWWRGTIPAQAAGTVLRWKIGAFRSVAASVFPDHPDSVARKHRMMTVFEIDGFDAETARHRIHNDYGPERTGLVEGFHVLRGRAFLNRFGRAAIYNTFVQVFYYDAETPRGEVVFPAENETLFGQSYGAVVRTDATVERVLYRILDGAPGNDDAATGNPDGNGAWAEARAVTASAAIGSEHDAEWRFEYRNVPPNGAARIEVRLLECSSDTNVNLDAAAAHVTELVRNVNTSGPDLPFRWDWPTVDGTAVDAGYVGRVRFAGALGDGLDDAALRDSFSVEIRADGASDARAVARSGFTVTRDRGDGLGELAFPFPGLYDPDAPEREYEVLARQVADSGLVSEARVRVVAVPVPPAPFVDIIEPEEVDVIGNRRDIVQPVVAANPGDREQRVRVNTDETATRVVVTVDGGASGVVAAASNPVALAADRLQWDFVWTVPAEGVFRIEARMEAGAGNVVATDAVTMRVRWLQLLEEDPADLDDDEDGLLDVDETTNPGPPGSGNSDTWTQGEIHAEWALGRTLPLSPDTDDDGLPDALELGWRAPTLAAETDLGVDSDANGQPNFVGDADPPFFNTLDNFGRVPGVTSAAAGGDRRARAQGSTTDPNNADSDYDGLPDGLEDANRNGWIDGDGSAVPAPPWAPWLGHDWPDGEMGAGETWLETDPNNPDTDGDGLSDGDEDADRDGAIAGDTDGDRVWDDGEVWTETNPLGIDSDADGLPDGWERGYGLDPLDAVGDNGPAGNPDGDTLVLGGVTGAYHNLLEFNNGTDPRRADTGGAPPAGSITVGPGPRIGVVGGRAVFEEFQDWTLEDLLVLDEYEENGPNHAGGDVFPGYDGFDGSRDLVAFYCRDGGDASGGGDGMMYFRVDLHDLRAFAESAGLDVYVVIDTGQPGNGERNLPDDVDTLTDMGWEAVVALYDGENGRVYVDTDPVNHSVAVGQELGAFGVEARDRGHPAGFGAAYFNSELDAVEFSIRRQALLDAGWNGLNGDDLNFQVFTTRDGTGNDPVGAGDIGGRSDIRDSVYDDWIAEDHWRAQAGLRSRLMSWFGRNGSNDRGRRARTAVVVHGNQHVLPGHETQELINDNAGAGYHRVIDAHEVFGQRLNLHVTPTLAMAMQWAAADPVAGAPWRDGPSFNARIGALAATGTVGLLGSTFSDHAMPYFPQGFHADNVARAEGVLTEIYGVTPSGRVFWIPERLADEGVLESVRQLGYSHALVDQMRHGWKWFGRTSALSEAGYRINRVNDMNLFFINDRAGSFRFRNHDGGLDLSLRKLFSRRARSGTQEQLVTLFSQWEDFGEAAQAAAWDANLRWIANRPWIECVLLDEVAAAGWSTVDRGAGRALAKTAHDFIDHATAEDYDRWYFGADIEESLAARRFAVRPGVLVPEAFGQVGVGGAAASAWTRATMATGFLARATAHAAVFETAFHDQGNNDLSKFSTGEYIHPDGDYHELAEFAKRAQAQMRMAAVQQWAESWNETNLAVGVTAAQDVDGDGEDEYLLMNGRVAYVFEALGGRLVGSWLKSHGRLFQMTGNMVAFDGDDTELEGTVNQTAEGATGAHRTSGLKDWYAVDGGGGSRNHVNDLFDVTPVAGGWSFASGDGAVRKTVTLGDTNDHVDVAYELSGGLTMLYVRCGLSPNLEDLLLHGQRSLPPLAVTGNRISQSNQAGQVAVTLRLGTNAAWSDATDDDLGTFTTVKMRNQAQVQQVEIVGSGSFGFQLALEGPESVVPPPDFDRDGDPDFSDPDDDNDGIPDVWENAYDNLNPFDASDAGMDGDGDGFTNLEEYWSDTRPDDADEFLVIADLVVAGNRVAFSARQSRWYTLQWTTALEVGAGGWTDVPGRVKMPGVDGEMSVTDPTATGALPSLRHYRVKAYPDTVP